MQPYTTELSEIGSPLTIRQPETGYRFSEDPFLLVNHALPHIHEQLDHRAPHHPLKNASEITSHHAPSPFMEGGTGGEVNGPVIENRYLNILDIGTGSGIIPLLLLLNLPKDTALITAIELQKRLFHVASENIRKNQMADRITLIHGDIKKFSLTKNSQKFDMILSNPPYIKRGCGRLNTDNEKTLARHEIALTLDELVQSASRLLKPRGQLFLIYPTQRFEELIEAMKTCGIAPSSIRWIHTRPRRKAKLFVISGIKGESEALVHLPPLYLTPA